MKKLIYLTSLTMILALFVLGCSSEAPTAFIEGEVNPQLSSALTGNPNGNCCPEGFDYEPGFGNPEDRNGDGAVCRKVTPERTITIDNNAPGNCCIPPDCAGG